MERENAWKKYEGEKQKEVFDFAEGYKAFLTKCKTERECTEEIIRQAKEHGYESLENVIASGRTLKAGDKVYAENMGKSLALYHIGEEPMENGMNILGAHVDSPKTGYQAESIV